MMRLALLCFAALVGGALNAMAGGGSFISFPSLLGAGVPPIEANATNTVALWPGQFTSIFGYWKDLRRHFHLLWTVVPSSLIGGVAGAFVLLATKQMTFYRMVPYLLLLAAILFWLSEPISKRLLRNRPGGADATDEQKIARLPVFILLVIVCFYIGYFGAGSGFLIMAALAIFGIRDLNEINALKVVSTTIANGSAVIIFIARGRVLWHYGLPMIFFAALGGYVGARLSRRLNRNVMRWFVIVLGFALAAYFFWKTWPR
jgi:uncharacterized membrane protein YfcA